jgi:hypothetical protein
MEIKIKSNREFICVKSRAFSQIFEDITALLRASVAINFQNLFTLAMPPLVATLLKTQMSSRD